jgi:hypothetical protein
MASVAIGGQTFTYDLRIDAQWHAYEHAIVHNDLVSTFGSDKTGALQSAVHGAQNALPDAQATAFARANARNAAAVSVPPNQYRYAGACSKSASSIRRSPTSIAMKPNIIITCPQAKPGQRTVHAVVTCCTDCPTDPTPTPVPVATATPTPVEPLLQPVDEYVYSWYTP